MAFVSNDEEDEKDQPNSNAQGPVSPAGGGGVHLAPSSGVGAAAPAGSSGGSNQANPGGSFATLNQYLTANQGQAAPLATKITDNIGQQYSGLDQTNQGVLQDIQGQVTNAPGYTASDSGLVDRESAAPVSFANDPNNVSAFQKQLTDSYGGPNSAEGVDKFQSQQATVNNAIAQGQAQTQTAAGQQQLVAQNSAAPTAGVTALNSAILSQDPTYLGKVQDAYKPFSNLVSNLNTGAQGIDKTIANETADAQKASSAAQGAITGQINNLNNTVNNQVTQAQTAGAAQNATVKNDLASGSVTPQDLKSLGISQDQWDSLSSIDKTAATSQLIQSQNGQFGADTGTSNIDNTQWLTQLDPNAAYNAANVATNDQYQQTGAFQTLLNGLNLQTPQMVLNSANSAQAGTAPTNLNSFDYATAGGTAAATAGSQRAAAQAYVDALQSGADDAHAQLAAQKAAKDTNEIAASESVIGIPTAVMSALGVGGDVGKYANQFTNTIAAPIKQADMAAINDAKTAAAGGDGTVGGTAKSVGAQAALNTVGLGIPQAIKTVANLFCFHPWTLIEMADGSLQPIFRIQVGDNTRGGKVMATTRGVGTHFYWYNGVLVTGKHAVKEDGWWVRVENSKQARKFNYLTEVVCNLVTESHRIFSNGVEFADEHETDQYEYLNLDDSIAEMNKLEVGR